MSQDHMKNDQKRNIYGATLDELAAIAEKHSIPSYAAGQIAGWLYKHHADAWGQMTNLSKQVRKMLQDFYTLDVADPVDVIVSSDGTKKYLFNVNGMGNVESAYIPEGERHTLCVSSQLGCRMGCNFCMTGRMGFHGQLGSGDILNQIRSIPERDQLTNIVYMGMGEPFDNTDEVLKSLEVLTSDWGFGMSPKRITVSTIGVLPGMKRFLEESRCNLAVSLHSPFEEERRALMPMNKAYPLKEVLDTIRSFPKGKQRRISFEYIVFGGYNHSASHVKELARVLQGIACRINLIRFHSIPDSHLKPPSEADLNQFKTLLEAKGFITIIRKSRGQDINAACGMLANESVKK